MKAHSAIGASSASRWMACPGSIKLSEGIPNRSSDYALEGTAAHQLAETCLVGEHDPAFFLGTKIKVEKDGRTVEFPVTQDMVDAVQVYVNYVRANDTFHTLIEHRFHLKQLHPDLYGTADCVQFFEDKKLLRVVDYKHGQGLPVEAVGNKQGLYYALGALITLKFPATMVEIVIVQPRCAHPAGPIRSWTVSVADLLDWQADLLDAVELTEQDGALLKAGDHCKFCPAAGVPGRCKALDEKTQAIARATFEPMVQYDPVALGQALHDMHAVEARIKAIREFAYAEAEAGRSPPGWKLVEKRAVRKLREGAIEELAKAIDVPLRDLLKDPEPKGITEIQKLAPGKNDKERAAALEPFVIKESSGHTLAPADDKREAVRISAKDAFPSLTLES